MTNFDAPWWYLPRRSGEGTAQAQYFNRAPK
jgi:hypothetical protein